ncbi:MAG: hypothetical protein KR126chlam1_00528 [Chlamydiae bacterium]|nr:hypothetical protein [Chlamydiota bacterium]
MAKVNQLLASRFKRASATLSKMTELAEMSSSGKLSSFSGVFRITPLSVGEEEQLHNLLQNYSKKNQEVGDDLKFLSTITSEVKAITNQAAILHGERIKKAQEILKKYRDGAFSSWLISTYGNRQTPYNFLQYYELYMSIPQGLQLKLDEMPRQAVYTLASRRCPKEEKEEVIKSYKGESKKELLSLIRERFPLAGKDRRGANVSLQILKQLEEIKKQLSKKTFEPSNHQRKQIKEALQSIENLL